MGYVLGERERLSMFFSYLTHVFSTLFAKCCDGSWDIMKQVTEMLEKGRHIKDLQVCCMKRWGFQLSMQPPQGCGNCFTK